VSDPISPDSVARSMGLGGDLPPPSEAPITPAAMSAVVTPVAVKPAASAAVRQQGEVARWRSAPVRAVVAIIVLTAAGYVLTWGDSEKDSRVLAAFSGGVALGAIVFGIGLVWWLVRLVIGRRRPFGRTVFNYPLVLALAAFGVLGAEDSEAYGAGVAAGAGSRSALTSAGSPRSGNGTSIASKSRGTTVAGNVARASSRTSRGK
jgi:hypothetical protein